MIGPIFIIGTGRSGTHWLAQSIEAHPDVHATIETEPMFSLSIRMALNPSLEKSLFGKLAEAYRHELSKPGIYLDKSHPNIWLAEKLKEAFPQSLFVGIQRQEQGTVASMMKHDGVLEWCNRWREFPIPNRFLGITERMADTYDGMPMAARCVTRWAAHRDRMKALKGILGDDLLVILYEGFVRNPQETLDSLHRFLGLRQSCPWPGFDDSA